MDTVEQMLQLQENYLSSAAQTLAAAFTAKAYKDNPQEYEKYRRVALESEQKTEAIKKELCDLWQSGGKAMAEKRHNELGRRFVEIERAMPKHRDCWKKAEKLMYICFGLSAVGTVIIWLLILLGNYSNSWPADERAMYVTIAWIVTALIPVSLLVASIVRKIEKEEKRKYEQWDQITSPEREAILEEMNNLKTLMESLASGFGK